MDPLASAISGHPRIGASGNRIILQPKSLECTVHRCISPKMHQTRGGAITVQWGAEDKCMVHGHSRSKPFN